MATLTDVQNQIHTTDTLINMIYENDAQGIMREELAGLERKLYTLRKEERRLKQREQQQFAQFESDMLGEW